MVMPCQKHFGDNNVLFSYNFGYHQSVHDTQNVAGSCNNKEKHQTNKNSIVKILINNTAIVMAIANHNTSAIFNN